MTVTPLQVDKIMENIAFGRVQLPNSLAGKSVHEFAAIYVDAAREERLKHCFMPTAVRLIEMFDLERLALR